MNQLDRRIWIPSLLAIFALSTNICASAADDYSKQSVAQLIDELTQIDSQALGIASYAMYGTFLANDATISLKVGEIGVPPSRVPPQMRELVRRGPLALPELIKHLDDRRPTKWEVGNKPGWSTSQIPLEAYWWTIFSDEYDPRSRRPSDEEPGSWPVMKDSKNFEGRYTMKVGDLCYTLIGQIVNRRLVAVHAQPSAGLMVNSPIEVPVLAEEVKKDWGKADAEELRASLLADLRATSSEKWYTQNFNNSALERLRLYFPETYNALEGDDLKRKEIFEAEEAKRGSAEQR